MAVVINDFEIVAKPAPQPQAGTQQEATSPQSSQLAPHDVERVVRRQLARLARVRAS